MSRQLGVFFILLLANAVLAFVTYTYVPLEQFASGTSLPPEVAAVPLWVLGLANAGIILVMYGLLGLAGYWFAGRLGMPGIYREQAGWRQWALIPAAVGAVFGGWLVVIDSLFTSLGDWPGVSHPPFPFSIIASATAGIGEEILYRLFVMGLWAFLLNLVLRRALAKRSVGKQVVFWVANLIAALIFAAGHLPAAMLILGVNTPAGLPPLVLLELFLLNGLIGLAAGERYIKDGLVAAVGVHFWADIVWHVAFPLLT